MTQLFKDDGIGNLEEVSLFDLCEWWIETYPEDIFIKEPRQVVEIRRLMQEILEMREK